MRTSTILLLFALPALAGVKVAGVDFVPRDLVFAAAEPKSQATSEGALPNECKWNFTSATRIAKRDDAQNCVRYYDKTTVTLAQSCPSQDAQAVTVTRSSERITVAGPFCPDSSGKVTPPSTEAHVISSGTTADGKRQDIVVQPDGTRITILNDDTSVIVTVVYTDGTGDLLKLP